MIDDILQERTPEQKPRFFLHDEMKAWLADNLEIKFRLSPNFSSDYKVINELQNNYGIYTPPLAGIAIETRVVVAGETIQLAGSNTQMLDSSFIYQIVLREAEIAKQQHAKLQYDYEQLKRRVDLLENPLPI